MSATSTGKKVLAGLGKGRQIAIAQAQARSQQRMTQIASLCLVDQQAGHPAWGRARRISRTLQGQLSERLVNKYLARLSSGADGAVYRGGNLNGGPHV